MRDGHGRIIASVAKAELAPIGFRQRGRLRLWLAGRGWWINVVKFIPGRWSRSVSLTNAEQELDTRFPDFDAVADVVMSEARGCPNWVGPGWWGL